jgi:hypothetical protein
VSTTNDPEPGQDRASLLALGHALIHIDPKPSGWKAECECGERFRGFREGDVLDRWHAHVDEERENRGIT